jgi:hypothetical protein
MRYMLLIYGDESRWDKQTESEKEAVVERYRQLYQKYAEAGIVLDGAELLGTDMATSVRLRQGDPLTTDGPFAETKEQLGGYFVIECDNLDEAIRFAGEMPGAETGTIEIRPLAGS